MGRGKEGQSTGMGRKGRKQIWEGGRRNGGVKKKMYHAKQICKKEDIITKENKTL